MKVVKNFCERGFLFFLPSDFFSLSVAGPQKRDEMKRTMEKSPLLFYTHTLSVPTFHKNSQ